MILAMHKDSLRFEVKKLEAAGLKDFIKTKRGQGYMI
jgi:DNA-binding response OmpR family regulator